MADTGWIYAANARNTGIGGTDWTSPANALTSNDLDADVQLVSEGDYSKRLNVYTFSAGIPAGATINGIEVGVERMANNDVKDYAIRLMDDATNKGDNKADTATLWPDNDTNAFYGGAADLWGATWSAAQVNAATFGIGVRAKSYQVLGSANANIDVIGVKITYTPATGGTDHLMIMGM